MTKKQTPKPPKSFTERRHPKKKISWEKIRTKLPALKVILALGFVLVFVICAQFYIVPEVYEQSVADQTPQDVLIAARNIPKDKILEKADLRKYNLVLPALIDYVKAAEIDEVIGRKQKKGLQKGAALRWDQLQPGKNKPKHTAAGP